MARETVSSPPRSRRARSAMPLPRASWGKLAPARDEPTPGGTPEAELRLTEGIRAGEEEAFRCLFDTYWERLVAYAEAIVGEREECQDVVLQAFVRVWRHREEWDASRSLRSYLYRITRNLALNARRDGLLRDARQRRANLIEPLALHRRTPAERFVESSLRADVEAAIGRLPERRREAFMLSRFQGLSHGEIAETLGISRQTVANQISAALTDLRESLARHIPDD